MPLAALVLVVIAAFAHASWNMLAKHAAFCRHFNLFYSVGSVLLYAPLAVWLLLHHRPEFSAAVLAIFVATGLLHVAYSDLLQRGYRAADMSVVYPVARGSGPLLSFCGAILVLQERPSLLALAGALLVVTGVLVIAGGPAIFKKAGTRTGVVWGVVIGCAIASYTLVDGFAVKVLLIAPPLVDYAGNLFRVAVLTPLALIDRPRAVNELKQYWRPAAGVAVLGPLAYILVLYAMTLAPVSPRRTCARAINDGRHLLRCAHLSGRSKAIALHRSRTDRVGRGGADHRLSGPVCWPVPGSIASALGSAYHWPRTCICRAFLSSFFENDSP